MSAVCELCEEVSVCAQEEGDLMTVVYLVATMILSMFVQL